MGKDSGSCGCGRRNSRRWDIGIIVKALGYPRVKRFLTVVLGFDENNVEGFDDAVRGSVVQPIRLRFLAVTD
jgi:hypothetical protein